MSEQQDTVVRHSVTVAVPVEKAFEVFTAGFGRFKPPEHNLLGVPITETVLEGHVGGALLDRGEDGSECRWGRVLAFEPPHRLVFSWDINPAWQIETDPARCSEVEVTFVPEGTDRTRVELEHRHFDRHGEGWDALRGGVDGDQGWPLYLQRYAVLFGGER